MGTSVAPAFANLYLHTLEAPILQKYKGCIKFYRRYIDDIFLVFEGDSKLYSQVIGEL